MFFFFSWTVFVVVRASCLSTTTYTCPTGADIADIAPHSDHHCTPVELIIRRRNSRSTTSADGEPEPISHQHEPCSLPDPCQTAAELPASYLPSASCQP